MAEGRKRIAEFRPRHFRRYPEYKDSRVEWLGEIPAHWGTTRVADQSTLINGYPFDSARFTLDEGMPLVRIRDLHATGTAVRFAGDPIAAARITTGDILIGMDGDFDVARWQGDDALLNQRMCCLRPRQSISGQFMYHCLPFPLRIVNDLTHSTTVKHLSSFDVKKVQLPCPPEAEQAVIASSIDRETAKIDALVAKKELLIELLQEKRTALITRAVTRGLDPTVPMKDSGIHWLGQIPAHWKGKKIKRLFAKTKRQGFPELTVLSVYRDYGVIQKSSRDDNFNRTPEDLSTYQVVNPGDLVINKMKAWQGSLGISSLSGITSPDYVVYLPRHQEERRFLHHFLRCKLLSSVYVTMSNGIRPNQWRLEPERFEELEVSLPPPDEQGQIAEFLDRETAKVDALVAKVRQAINHLNEYRTALISAAVTGKIDVRMEAA